jgi:hypothetical protein
VRSFFSRLRNRLFRAEEVLNQIHAVTERLDEEKSAAEKELDRHFRSHKECIVEIASQHAQMATVMGNFAADATARLNSLQSATQEVATRLSLFEEIHHDCTESLEEVRRDLRQLKKDLELGARMPARRRVRVLFLFQVPETWTTWKSVWEACEKAPEIDASIVLLPFLHGSAGDPARARRFLADHQLPFVDASVYDVGRELPDVVFFQNPYDSTRPPEWSAARFADRGIRIAYIPYGLDVGGGESNLRWQFDLDVQRRAWRIFVRSEQHRRMYGLHCESGSRHVVVTGHPKLDSIATHRGAREPIAGNGRRVILWCPHFSIEAGGWSTFEAISQPILAYFEAEPEGVSLLIRPHPLFFGRMQEVAGVGDQPGETFRRRVERAAYIELDESEQYAAAFERSAALMADAGSFLLEYLPTGKPILYLENPAGPGLNESADFVQSYYQASDFEGVKRFLDMVRREEDPRREERLARVGALLHRTDGLVGAHIASHIAEQLAQDSPSRSHDLGVDTEGAHA